MTEEIWQRRNRVDAMLDWYLENCAPSKRKLQLFAIACCQHGWPKLTEAAKKEPPRAEPPAEGASVVELVAEGWKAVQLVERHIEGEVPAEQVEATRERLKCIEAEHKDSVALGDATQSALAAIEGDILGAVGCGVNYREAAESVWVANTLREIFGNPFHPIEFDPAWRSVTALSLARMMYNSKLFGAMPMLASALEAAGCTVPEIIAHCRDKSLAHVRGCWVVDFVLDKE